MNNSILIQGTRYLRNYKSIVSLSKQLYKYLKKSLYTDNIFIKSYNNDDPEVAKHLAKCVIHKDLFCKETCARHFSLEWLQIFKTANLQLAKPNKLMQQIDLYSRQNCDWLLFLIKEDIHKCIKRPLTRLINTIFSSGSFRSVTEFEIMKIYVNKCKLNRTFFKKFNIQVLQQYDYEVLNYLETNLSHENMAKLIRVICECFRYMKADARNILDRVNNLLSYMDRSMIKYILKLNISDLIDYLESKGFELTFDRELLMIAVTSRNDEHVEKAFKSRTFKLTKDFVIDIIKKTRCETIFSILESQGALFDDSDNESDNDIDSENGSYSDNDSESGNDSNGNNDNDNENESDDDNNSNSNTETSSDTITYGEKMIIACFLQKYGYRKLENLLQIKKNIKLSSEDVYIKALYNDDNIFLKLLLCYFEKSYPPSDALLLGAVYFGDIHKVKLLLSFGLRHPEAYKLAQKFHMDNAARLIYNFENKIVDPDPRRNTFYDVKNNSAYYNYDNRLLGYYDNSEIDDESNDTDDNENHEEINYYDDADDNNNNDEEENNDNNNDINEINNTYMIRRLHCRNVEWHNKISRDNDSDSSNSDDDVRRSNSDTDINEIDNTHIPRRLRCRSRVDWYNKKLSSSDSDNDSSNNIDNDSDTDSDNIFTDRNYTYDPRRNQYRKRRTNTDRIWFPNKRYY